MSALEPPSRSTKASSNRGGVGVTSASCAPRAADSGGATPSRKTSRTLRPWITPSTTSGRRVASVTAATDGQVLVLRRRFVDELMKNDPACAAEVLFGLARVLADRQYAPAS